MSAPSRLGYKPPKLERQIEARFMQEVKKLGCITRKLNGLGHSDWPDRLVLGPHGYQLFIEFKRPGGKVTSKQHALHWRLKQLGHSVEVFDDWKAALEYVRSQLNYLLQLVGP